MNKTHTINNIYQAWIIGQNLITFKAKNDLEAWNKMIRDYGLKSIVMISKQIWQEVSQPKDIINLPTGE